MLCIFLNVFEGKLKMNVDGKSFDFVEILLNFAPKFVANGDDP